MAHGYVEQVNSPQPITAIIPSTLLREVPQASLQLQDLQLDALGVPVLTNLVPAAERLHAVRRANIPVLQHRVG